MLHPDYIYFISYRAILFSLLRFKNMLYTALIVVDKTHVSMYENDCLQPVRHAYYIQDV